MKHRRAGVSRLTLMKLTSSTNYNKADQLLNTIQMTTQTFTLDPVQRFASSTITPTGSSESTDTQVNHYSDSSDSKKGRADGNGVRRCGR